jgi:hypothetical protein
MLADRNFRCEAEFGLGWSTPSRISLWLAASSPEIEKDPADDRDSPENGGPDSDPLANKSRDDDRQKNSDIGCEEKEGSTSESAHEA